MWQPENKFDEWKDLTYKKVRHFSASNDSLWMIDYDSRMPHQFNELTQQWDQAGDQEAFMIEAGMFGQATIRGSLTHTHKNRNSRLYGWDPLAKEWYPSVNYAAISSAQGQRLRV